MTDRLLLKFVEAAEAIGVSRRKWYELIATDAAFRNTVVEVPGLRGKRVRTDLLRAAIEGLSPVPTPTPPTASSPTRPLAAKR